MTIPEKISRRIARLNPKTEDRLKRIVAEIQEKYTFAGIVFSLKTLKNNTTSLRAKFPGIPTPILLGTFKLKQK